MANASVEKLKALGIRHGEKAVVGLTATLFVVFTALAVIRPTLEMKPEELSATANRANSNLNLQQPPNDVLAKLEKDGLVEPNLVKVVENQLKNAIKPDAFKPKLEWVTPEPGAGLIRDQPELIAPTELAAFPGRGGILMYKLDDNGQKILDTGPDAKEKGKSGRRNAQKQMKPEEKKRLELEEEKRKAQFAGQAEEKEKGKDEAEAEPAVSGPYKEETKGKRWVVITGVIDNEQLKKNYLLALKDPAVAYPDYKRIDVERRNLQSDGSWTEWAATEKEKNWDILDNLPEKETEYVPASQRLDALVDALPFLRAGYWTGVHVAKLVPPDVLEGPKTKKGGPGGGGGPMDSGEGAGARGGGGASRQAGPPGGGMMGMAGGGSSRQASGGPGPGAGSGEGLSAAEGNFIKSDEKLLMIRSLDFTVDGDMTYQYRLRIVVNNPNKDHTDVNPGVDIDSKILVGPWSEPTDPVTIPADVAAYAMAPDPATARRNDLVSFQVIKWDSASGQTLVKSDAAGPGEIVGEYGQIQEPSSDGGGPKSAAIDFNSRAIVLDTYGGARKLPDIPGIDRNQFIIPALAMIIEPDGSVVMRDQTRDTADEVRDDMYNNYHQALADSEKTRAKGSGSRMPGAPGKKKKRR